jgi:hypothetical protein
MYKTLINRRELDTLEANIADPDKWGCELYTSQLNGHKAGQMHIKKLGKRVSAHRVFYSLRRDPNEKPITEQDYICHNCSEETGRPDEPRNCITHLKRMTPQEHIRDTVSKGQFRRGSRHRNAKLNEHLVYHFRCLHVKGELGMSMHALARVLGVKQPSLFNALNGKTYKHVPMPGG